LYRLAVVPIEIPPLRERLGDIPLLVEYFIIALEKGLERSSRPSTRNLSNCSRIQLAGERSRVTNVIERAVILCEGETFSVEESWLKREAPPRFTRSERSMARFVKQEMQIIEAALHGAWPNLRDGGGSGEIGAAHRARSTQKSSA